MLARALTAILVTVTAVSAWPILFYPGGKCDFEPVLVLHEPPIPGRCASFPAPVNSYSGGTADRIQKLLVYYDDRLCTKDAAHRVYSNLIINSTGSECVPFGNKTLSGGAYTFIEEFMPLPVPPTSNFSATCDTALTIQV